MAALARAMATALALARSRGRARAIPLGRSFCSAQSSPESPESAPAPAEPPKDGTSRLWKWVATAFGPEMELQDVAKSRLKMVKITASSMEKIKDLDLDEGMEMIDGAEEQSSRDYFAMAKLYMMQGSGDKVLLCADKAEKLVTPGSVEHAVCLHTAADGFYIEQDYEKCLEKLKTVEAMAALGETREGQDVLAETEIRIAELYAFLGKINESVAMFNSGIAKKEKLFEDKAEIFDAYFHAAQAMSGLGRLQEAGDYCKKAVESARKSSQEAQARHLRMFVYKRLKQLPKAIEEAKVLRDLFAKDDPEEAKWTDLDLADMYMQSEKNDEAKQLLESILDDDQVRGRLKAFAHASLAKVCVLKNEVDEAIANTEESSMILRKEKTLTLKDAETFAELATFFEAVKDFDSAIDHFEEAQRIYVNFPEAVSALAETYARIGHIYLVTEKTEAALSKLARAVSLIEGKLGLEHPDLGDILNTMGIANLERKNLVMASGQFERAKAISLKHFGGGHPNTLAATLNMVAAYSALNRWDKAIKCQAEVVKNLEEQNAEPEVLSRNREMLEKLQQIQANAATAAHSAGIS